MARCNLRVGERGPQGLYPRPLRYASLKNGQYLDLSLKGSRYENEFGYTGLGRFIDGQSNSTGFSFGAEYGYKKKDEKGWFVEPQAQVVLGHFRNDAFTDSNGVHVEGESLNTALGRIGARLGMKVRVLRSMQKPTGTMTLAATM